MALKIGIIVPHIFMQNDLLPKVIFSPGELALSLANKLSELGHEVTLFSPGNVTTKAKNVTADLSGFEQELMLRGDTYLSLLKKHPLTFITLARQAQAELLKLALKMANNNQLDVVHIYTNEEELGLIFSDFCTKPVVFTHHDPFNFLVGYRNIMPQYSHKNWLALSESQKKDMPPSTNWLATIYNSLDENLWPNQPQLKENYVAYYGRIIENKGVHIAIAAVQKYNQAHLKHQLKLKIAGKYYNDKPSSYWHKQVKPALDDPNIEYVGFIGELEAKQEFLGKARALLVPSLWAEPFGMVMLEALASSTPVIGLNSGAIPEVIKDGETGFVVNKELLPVKGLAQQLAKSTVEKLASALTKIDKIDSRHCRADFEKRFTLTQMTKSHIAAYQEAKVA